MFLFCGCTSYMTVHSRSSCSSGVFLPVHDQTSFFCEQDQFQFCYRAALEYLGSFDHYANWATHTTWQRAGKTGGYPRGFRGFPKDENNSPHTLHQPSLGLVGLGGGSGHRHHWIRWLPGLCVARLRTLQCDDHLPQALVFCIWVDSLHRVECIYRETSLQTPYSDSCH